MPDGFIPSLVDADYHPERLLDAVMARLGLKNDAALALVLEVSKPVLSKVRNRRCRISDPLLIRMHEEAGFSIKELKTLMGNRPER